MTPMNHGSRALLISLLREANIVEEIVEDVATACKLADYSVFSLASKDIGLKTLAEKLFLTKQEAMTLRRVAVARLRGENIQPIKPQSTPGNQKPDFSKMVSVHVVASHSDVCYHRQKASMMSTESFMGRDCEKKRIDTSSYGSLDLPCQLMDSAAEHGSSICNFYEDSPKDHFTATCDPLRPVPRRVSKTCTLETEGSDSGDSLTDSNLADHNKSCRPVIPRLHLEDAGLSYGPPNSFCPSYETLDSLSPSELEQLADLPVDHPRYRKARSFNEEVASDGLRRGAHMDPMKLKTVRGLHRIASHSIPSYRNVSHCIHKTTAAFEASKKALRDHQEQKAKMRTLSKDKSLKLKPKSKESKHLSSNLLKPTRATLARMGETKDRIQERTVLKKANSTSTI